MTKLLDPAATMSTTQQEAKKAVTCRMSDGVTLITEPRNDVEQTDDCRQVGCHPARGSDHPTGRARFAHDLKELTLSGALDATHAIAQGWLRDPPQASTQS